MSDQAPDGGTPVWGWVIILAAVAMFVALIVHTLGTGG